MHVRIRRLDADLPLPAAQHPDDAGYDLYAAVDAHLDSAGGRALVPTGIAIAVPSGCAGFVLPRSGLALNHGVTCLNTPGLIDPLYRIAPRGLPDVEIVEWAVVDDLGLTERNTFGSGSTGS